MTENAESTEYKARPASFLKLFLIGTGMAILGSLVGWVAGLLLLLVLGNDYVLEGYAWLTVLLSFTLVPLECLGFGVLAGWRGPKIAEKHPSPLKFVAKTGLFLGLGTWIGLSLLTYILVTFLA